jgi:hypothetical protein
MGRDVAGVRSTLYAIMRDYLNDARGNLVLAQNHVGAGKWRAAASACSIASRLLLDLNQEIADDEILLARQRNQITRDANQVRQQLWQVAQQVRRGSRPSDAKWVAKMRQSFVVYDGNRSNPRAAEA